MANKVVKETLDNNPTASAETLHPKAGADGSGEGPKDVAPSHSQMVADMMGAFAAIDKSSKTDWYNKMIEISKSYFNQDKGDSEANKSSIDAHPSDAEGSNGHGEKMPFGGDQNPAAVTKVAAEAVKQDVANLLEGTEGLTEEFKERAQVIFEAAVNARVMIEAERLEEEAAEFVADQVAVLAEAMEEKVGTYLEYVAEEWMSQNEVAIESALRNEIAADFIGKLRDLFIENNINIPEEQVEVVDELAAKVDELETKLAEQIQENAELRHGQEEAARVAAIAEMSEGLTLASAEKFKQLAEGIEYSDLEDFSKKLTMVREGFKAVKTSTVETLLEDTSNDAETVQNLTENTEVVHGPMSRYVDAIRRTNYKK